MSNLEKLKQYFNQAEVGYTFRNNNFEIDFNVWVYYVEETKYLELCLEPSLRNSYNRLSSNDKKKFIEYMFEKFNIEIKTVSS